MRVPLAIPGCALLLFAAVTGVARGQDLPAVRANPGSSPYTGYQLPSVQGTLSYSLSLSERVVFGYAGGSNVNSNTVASGSLGYLSGSEVHPFSAVYSGGYLFDTSGLPSSSFHNLALSQVLNLRRWNITGSNVLNYLPETPTTGLYGLPGTGQAGLPPFTPVGGQDVLTPYASRVDNTTSVSVSHPITGKVAATGSGSYRLQRFLGDAGTGALQSDNYTGSFTVTRHLSALAAVSGDYTYSKFTYVGSPFSFQSNGVSVQYQRALSRSTSVDFGGGPQWTSSTNPAQFRGGLNFTASATYKYRGRYADVSGSYQRSTNNGSGVTAGARTDTLRASASRQLNRAWHGSADIAYSNVRSLTVSTVTPFNAQNITGGFQLSRSLTQFVSFFGSYYLQKQVIGGTSTNAALAYNGVQQILGFGITYSPRPLRLGGH